MTRKITEMKVSDVTPSRAAVFLALGVPVSAPVDEQIGKLVDDAIGQLAKLASPVTVSEPITLEAFALLYEGDGKNAPDTPLGRIFPRASGLALFAVTIGEGVSRRISELFARDEFSQGAALDAAASECVELVVNEVERVFRDGIRKKDTHAVTMPFSPGYCGWDITGQRKLFAGLSPSEIGIELNESCLMKPLKSVSGVLVSGGIEIFDHDDDFPFCDHCQTRDCRERLQNLNEQ